jgi:hypothetical protein
MKKRTTYFLSGALFLWGCNTTTTGEMKTKNEPEKPKKEESAKKEVPKEEKVEFSPLWASLFEEGAQSTWQETYTSTYYSDEAMEQLDGENAGEVEPKIEVKKKKITLTVEKVIELKPGLWEATIKTSRTSDLSGKWYTDGKTCWSDKFMKQGGNPSITMNAAPVKGKKSLSNGQIKLSTSYNKTKAMWVYNEENNSGNPIRFAYYFDEKSGMRGYTWCLENHFGDEKIEVWRID